jgi:thioredoxin 1
MLCFLLGCGQSTKPATPQGGQSAKPGAASPGVQPAAEGAAVASVGDTDFTVQVLQSDKPVLVDFFATWCGPCQTQGPIVDKVAAHYADKLKVFRLDVDQAPKTAKQYQITAIPTLIVFKGGKVVFNRTGLMDEAQLSSELDKLF